MTFFKAIATALVARNTVKQFTQAIDVVMQPAPIRWYCTLGRYWYIVILCSALLRTSSFHRLHASEPRATAQFILNCEAAQLNHNRPADKGADEETEERGTKSCVRIRGIGKINVCICDLFIVD